MLFDGRLVETLKHTHKGRPTSFTKQFEILFRRAQAWSIPVTQRYLAKIRYDTIRHDGVH